MTPTSPPIIGITCRVLSAPHTPARFGQNQAYVNAIARAGAAPCLIPPVSDLNLLKQLYRLCDGLLLPGGEDVHPGYYGERPSPRLREVSEMNDGVELALARLAIGDRKPLLAICRGIQVLNVVQGGTLYQDLGLRRRQTNRHDWFPGYPRDRLSHPVDPKAGTRLAAIIGTEPYQVNSLHHQAIKRLGGGLVVAARADDDVVEAVEVEGHPFALGVQWHPEELAPNDPRAQLLFDAFIAACRP